MLTLNLFILRISRKIIVNDEIKLIITLKTLLKKCIHFPINPQSQKFNHVSLNKISNNKNHSL